MIRGWGRPYGERRNCVSPDDCSGATASEPGIDFGAAARPGGCGWIRRDRRVPGGVRSTVKSDRLRTTAGESSRITCSAPPLTAHRSAGDETAPHGRVAVGLLSRHGGGDTNRTSRPSYPGTEVGQSGDRSAGGRQQPGWERYGCGIWGGPSAHGNSPSTRATLRSSSRPHPNGAGLKGRQTLRAPAEHQANIDGHGSSKMNASSLSTRRLHQYELRDRPETLTPSSASCPKTRGPR